MIDLTEFNKLEKWLKENNINYKRIEKPPLAEPIQLGFGGIGERNQLWITDDKGEYLWDAICYYGSYGFEDGLLEIMGCIVDIETAGDRVEGYLTADEVIERIKKWQSENRKEQSNG